MTPEEIPLRTRRARRGHDEGNEGHAHEEDREPSTYLDYRRDWVNDQRESQFDSQRRTSSGRGSIAPSTGDNVHHQYDIDIVGRPRSGAKQWLEDLCASANCKRSSSGEKPNNVDEAERKNLTETTATQPAAYNERKDDPLEQPRRSHGPTVGEEEQQDLTEVAAPGPVAEEDQNSQWRGQQHLEDGPQYDHRKDFIFEPEPVSTWETQLYIVCHLIFFSILGTLARLSTQWVTFYPGAPVVFSNLWANVGGTLMMGFFAEDRKIFMEEWGTPASPSSPPTKDPRGTASSRAQHLKIKKTIPLYIGLTVGFCGSFTSFSTFERDIFLALANKLPTPLNHPVSTSAGASLSSNVPRNGGYSFEAILAVIILTLTACIGAVHFGAHCAIALDRFMPTIPFRFTRRVLHPLIVFLGIGCWVGAIVMAAVPPDRLRGPAYAGHGGTWRGQVLFALVFAPVGCLLRFYLSLKLNALVAWFPLGTFAANTWGTAAFGMAYDLQRARLSGAGVGGGVTGCQVLQGVQDGFCGTLTTVSTWVVELTTLRRGHAYFYGLTSVFAGLILLIVIMGSVLWTIGFQTPVCAIEIS